MCFRDSEGETCYEHALEGAEPLPRWRSLLFASVALSTSCGYLGLSDASHSAAFETETKVRPDMSVRRAAAFRAGLRVYAAKLGDDEHAESYASGLRDQAMKLGLMAYAAAFGDPTIRPAWVVDGFALYRKIRWPKDGDPCPKCDEPMRLGEGEEYPSCKVAACVNPEPVDPEEVKRKIGDLLGKKLSGKKGKGGRR